MRRLENEHLKKTPSAETVPLRVKALRRHLLAVRADETGGRRRRGSRRGPRLDDVQLVLQLYSYPGDYLSEKPTIERMAETVEKFEEDIYGAARPKGRRRARCALGEPIDLKAMTPTAARTAAHDVTVQLEAAIQGLMAQSASAACGFVFGGCVTFITSITQVGFATLGLFDTFQVGLLRLPIPTDQTVTAAPSCSGMTNSI